MKREYLKVAMPWGEMSVEFYNGVIYSASLSGDISADAEPGQWPNLKEKLLRYASGQQVCFDEPLALDDYSPFYKKVWQYLQHECPWGTVKTYQQVAEGVGSPKAARAVGNAMRLNPIALFIP